MCIRAIYLGGSCGAGMLAAESAFEALSKESSGPITLSDYARRFRESWLYDELYHVCVNWRVCLSVRLLDATSETDRNS